MLYGGVCSRLVAVRDLVALAFLKEGQQVGPARLFLQTVDLLLVVLINESLNGVDGCVNGSPPKKAWEGTSEKSRYAPQRQKQAPRAARHFRLKPVEMAFFCSHVVTGEFPDVAVERYAQNTAINPNRTGLASMIRSQFTL